MLILDTSALVSLAIADSYDDLIAEFDVHTTDRVQSKLRATADYEDVHGNGAVTVLDRSDQLSVHEVDVETFESSRIDAGEGSCVALCGALDPDFLVTDDLRALPELQALVETQVAISPIVLRALVERGRIENDTARKRLEALAEGRDWLEAPIYRRAAKLFDD